MPTSPARADDPRPPRRTLRIELQNAIGAPIDPALLRKVVRRVLAAEAPAGPLRLAIHLSDDAALRDANRRQRGIDRPTDVLSFPLLGELQPGLDTFVLPPGEPRHLGDVLISYERAAAQAAEYGHSVEREVCYLLAHGVLHLLGHDHLDEPQRRAMRQREETALQPLGLCR